MPITSAGSYLPVTQEFLNHWDQVNTALGSPLTLSGGYAIADLTSDRAAIDAAITATEGSDNVRQTAATARDNAKAGIFPRVAQFRAGVQFQLRGTGYVGALPRVPKFSANQSLFLKAFDDVANLWLTINAGGAVGSFTPPLLLLGGQTQASFASDLAALRALFVDVSNANEAARLNRKMRDVLLKPVKNRLLEYRLAVLATLGPGDALTLSLPTITPLPGSTPKAVVLSMVYNNATNKADGVYTASDNPNLAQYSLRTAPVPYKAAEETVIATFPPGTLTFSTDVGLGAPGATAQYRIYVELTTGNEKGSNTVGVTRPL